MADDMPFDPAAVQRERERAERQKLTATTASKAADALLWFSEFALSRDGAVTVTAQASSSTPNFAAANDYLGRAAAQFARQILDAAIEAAKADLAALPPEETA